MSDNNDFKNNTLEDVTKCAKSVAWSDLLQAWVNGLDKTESTDCCPDCGHIGGEAQMFLYGLTSVSTDFEVDGGDFFTLIECSKCKKTHQFVGEFK